MRKIIMGSVFGCALGMLTFVYLSNGIFKTDVSEVTVRQEKQSSMDNSEKILTLLKRDGERNQQQIALLQESQATFAKSLSALIKQVESLAEQQLDSGNKRRLQDEEAQELTRDATGKKIPSDFRLDEYMDSSLQLEDWNESLTETVARETQEQLSRLPGVILDEIRCGDGFCRAGFTRVDGERPDVADLWGYPPFMNEGLTIPQADGSVVVYFTEEGVSLDSLRQEALAGH